MKTPCPKGVSRRRFLWACLSVGLPGTGRGCLRRRALSDAQVGRMAKWAG